MTSIARKTLLIVATLIFFSCPLLFLAGMVAPRALGFLDTTICPSGMHLDNKSTTQNDLRGNVTAVNILCTNGEGQSVDATPQMLLLLFSIPVIGLVVMLIRSRFPDQQSETAAPESAT
jgi:hypothetical protein